jgi:hypothetical protein
MVCIAHILLNLPLLPARRRIAELRIEDIMTGHRREPRIHIAPLADSDLVDGGLHIVVDTPTGYAFEDAEVMLMCIEQHLMRLQQIGPHQKGAAVQQLDMCHLQLDPFATDISPIFAPVEQERLAWCEHQRHESSTIRRMMRPLPFALPFPGEGCKTLIGADISKLHQIGVHQLYRPALFA